MVSWKFDQSHKLIDWQLIWISVRKQENISQSEQILQIFKIKIKKKEMHEEEQEEEEEDEKNLVFSFSTPWIRLLLSISSINLILCSIHFPGSIYSSCSVVAIWENWFPCIFLSSSALLCSRHLSIFFKLRRHSFHV